MGLRAVNLVAVHALDIIKAIRMYLARSQKQLSILAHFVNTCIDSIFTLKLPHVSQSVNTSRSTRILCAKSQSFTHRINS